MENKTLILHPYGDTELWFASGDGWSLPLHVQWRHDKDNDRHYGLVMPAVGLYYSQGLTLIALLQMHDIQGRNDRWLIPRNMVEALLHKAPGITAVAYYKWNEPDMPAIPIPKVLKIDKVSGITTELATSTPEMSSQDPFIKYISERTGINGTVVKVVMKAVCDHSSEWLVEKRRTIDLGFCKLFAAPFRANWKEIVAFKFKKWKLLEMFKAPGKWKYEKLEDAGMPSAFCSMHNIAIKKSGQKHRVSYTLEAVPTNRFEKTVDAIERKRIACGGTSYVASFERTVEALYHHLLDALENHLHKTSLPFASLSERSSTGELRLLPTSSSSIKVRGVGIRDIPAHVITPDSPFSLTGGRSDEELVLAQAAQMSKMPALLQAPEDMRECAGESDVDHDDGQDRTTRLLLRNVDQGEREGEPVLPCATLGTGDSSGMDRC